MKGKEKLRHIVVYFGFVIHTCVHAQVTLSIHPQQVNEYSSQTMLCAYTGTVTITAVSWFKARATAGVLRIKNNACEPFRLPDPGLYNYNCSVGTNTFALTILNVTRANKGEIFECSVTPSIGDVLGSNGVSPDIIVPISSVTMTQPVTDVVTVQVTTPAIFVCETSGGLPAAQVSWFKNSGTEDDINITSWSSSTSNTSDNLIKVTSRLEYSPIKSDRNTRIYCTANNGGSNTYISSRKPLLDVQYPPEFPPVIRQGTLNVTEQTINVRELTPATLSCSVTGGNPLANLTWNCNNGSIAERTYGETVTKEVTWTASREQTGSCSCVSTHINWLRSVSTKIEILYPPSKPTFSIGSTSVSDTVAVIQNKMLIINCNSDSKPPPIYTWRYKTSTTDGYQMSIPNIQTSSNGLYTCDVQNTMVPSVGDSVTGKQNSSVTVQVLYAPMVHSLATEDILEGQQLTKVCVVTPGNPSTTTYTWKKETDNRTWQSQTLSIINVSRSNASYYTCTAKNTMTPSVESEVTGEDSKSFFLNVLFSSSIRLFTLNGVQESSIVSENDTGVPVICEVDSNPGSLILIQRDGTTLKTQNDTKQLNFSLAQAQCTDAGYYRCIGRNAHNAEPAVKEIRLFVKCSPRPSPYVPLIDRLRTGLHRSTTLEFSALSYPEPTTFKWFKVTDSALIPIEHMDNTLIISEAVNTSLTIVNVTENSFGKYLLTVHNELGDWNQSYVIEAYDKPEQPKDFKSLDEKATISSVTLQWIPGFNGGQPQTFVLQYRKIGTQQWITVNITHHNETMMTYPIQHLSSGTQYEVVVFATNSIGDSEQSQSITVSTNNQTSPPNYGAMIGGAVGGGSGLAILVVVIVLLLRRLKIRNGKDTSQLAFNKTGKTATEEDSSDEDVVVENAMYQTAGPLKTTDNNIYAKPAKNKKVDEKDANFYASVDKTKKKDNQKAKKGKQTKKKHDVQGDIYENAPEKPVAVDNTYGNAAFEDNPYENPETTKTKQTQKKTVNTEGLIYADLDFKDQTKGKKKLVIHGLDQMTDYVQVDFTKKADPLPDSDTEDQATRKQ